MQNIIRYARECEDDWRAKHDLGPATDLQVADRLLAMRCHEAAEVVLGKIYADRDRQ